MARSFEVPVEGTHILQFARSIADDNPVYSDREAALAGGFPERLAPPTFLVAADTFDPAYDRRPRTGERWLGSGREAIGSDAGPQRPAGQSGFHAGQVFEYHRHPVAGETLTAHVRDGDTWQKQGRRGGVLTFREIITEFVDAAGEPAVTMTWINVSTSQEVAR
ncbi:MAG: MaoC family dehydratase N-terminal domain-containing protein [Acidimicrobiales bacterium]|nr:MaoC family dehydratase N-terminal domain-containing protein [Acidimicrobiales bacterium]